MFGQPNSSLLSFMVILTSQYLIMKSSRKQLNGFCSLLVLLHAANASGGSQFRSHVTVNTPARSYSHGVGDPIPSGRRYHQRQLQRPFRGGRHPPLQNQGDGGYPRERPTIPFNNEERPRSYNNVSPWHQNSFQEIPIPLLPPSPYKVDSADPESLWPDGLFLPPLRPHTFAVNRRSDTSHGVPDSDNLDPYLLQGSEAIAAVRRAENHGLYYFHDIPHIESILENQQLRLNNNLKPHRLGSIRHTWPYNRP